MIISAFLSLVFQLVIGLKIIEKLLFPFLKIHYISFIPFGDEDFKRDVLNNPPYYLLNEHKSDIVTKNDFKCDYFVNFKTLKINKINKDNYFHKTESIECLTKESKAFTCFMSLIPFLIFIFLGDSILIVLFSNLLNLTIKSCVFFIFKPTYKRFITSLRVYLSYYTGFVKVKACDIVRGVIYKNNYEFNITIDNGRRLEDFKSVPDFKKWLKEVFVESINNNVEQIGFSGYTIKIIRENPDPLIFEKEYKSYSMAFDTEFNITKQQYRRIRRENKERQVKNILNKLKNSDNKKLFETDIKEFLNNNIIVNQDFGNVNNIIIENSKTHFKRNLEKFCDLRLCYNLMEFNKVCRSHVISNHDFGLGHYIIECPLELELFNELNFVEGKKMIISKSIDFDFELSLCLESFKIFGYKKVFSKVMSKIINHYLKSEIKDGHYNFSVDVINLMKKRKSFTPEYISNSKWKYFCGAVNFLCNCLKMNGLKRIDKRINKSIIDMITLELENLRVEYPIVDTQVLKNYIEDDKEKEPKSEVKKTQWSHFGNKSRESNIQNYIKRDYTNLVKKIEIDRIPEIKKEKDKMNIIDIKPEVQFDKDRETMIKRSSYKDVLKKINNIKEENKKNLISIKLSPHTKLTKNDVLEYIKKREEDSDLHLRKNEDLKKNVKLLSKYERDLVYKKIRAENKLYEQSVFDSSKLKYWLKDKGNYKNDELIEESIFLGSSHAIERRERPVELKIDFKEELNFVGENIYEILFSKECVELEEKDSEANKVLDKVVNNERLIFLKGFESRFVRGGKKTDKKGNGYDEAEGISNWFVEVPTWGGKYKNNNKKRMGAGKVKNNLYNKLDTKAILSRSIHNATLNKLGRSGASKIFELLNLRKIIIDIMKSGGSGGSINKMMGRNELYLAIKTKELEDEMNNVNKRFTKNKIINYLKSFVNSFS